LTDAGAQLLAASCHKLQYAQVGGTYVTSIGAQALAERCSLAQASTGCKGKGFNLCVYRNDITDAEIASLRARFPVIHVFG